MDDGEGRKLLNTVRFSNGLFVGAQGYSIAFNWPNCDYELKNIHTYELDGPPRRIFN